MVRFVPAVLARPRRERLNPLVCTKMQRIPQYFAEASRRNAEWREKVPDFSTPKMRVNISIMVILNWTWEYWFNDI